jgi:hypothetical protein
MAENTQWEYRAAALGTFWREPKDEEIVATLDQWGEEGWEVISVINLHGTSKLRVIAKRPLTTRSRRLRSMPGY